MMRDEIMQDQGDLEESDHPQPDTREPSPNPFVSMQTELHNKGAVLTKAWSDLFSFVTKYQAEIMVKENSVEIAEREVNLRKKQLEELKPAVAVGNAELSRLQEEINVKEQLLSKAQMESSVKEQMLQRVQSDLSSHMGLLEKSRSELLEKQGDLIRHRSDLERLRSELTIKDEQIQIKDNLLKKLQNQLMRENAELKEQLDLEKRNAQLSLEVERRAHEMTKRSLRQNSSKSSASVIEIPDSPPTLDLSVESADFGLSNIISMTESRSQTMDQESHSHSRLSQEPSFSLPSHASSSASSLSELSRRFSNTTQGYSNTTQSSMAQSREPPSWRTPPKVTPTMSSSPFKHSESAQKIESSFMEGATTSAGSSSDVFFPLSVSAEDSMSELDNSTMLTDSDVKGQIVHSGQMPGTPGSGTSDSNQGPVPVSGPIPSSMGMSPGATAEGGGEGKSLFQCEICKTEWASMDFLMRHMWTSHKAPQQHSSPDKIIQCFECGKTFAATRNLRRHMLLHSGEKPFVCDICGKAFSRQDSLRKHTIITHSGFDPQTILESAQQEDSLSEEFKPQDIHQDDASNDNHS